MIRKLFSLFREHLRKLCIEQIAKLLGIMAGSFRQAPIIRMEVCSDLEKLKYIGFERIRNFESILVLGVAGGSVIKTLVDEIKFKGKITGIEIDQEIITIANDYFQLDKIPNLEIVIDDAFEYVLKTKLKYDLIIIDIFQDTTMPNFLFEDFFIQRINSLLNLNGFILFNTMVINQEQEERNLLYKSKFDGHYSLRMYPKVETHNELFTIKKLL